MSISTAFIKYLGIVFAILKVSNLLFSSHLYQIAHLGDDDGERMFSSANPLEEGDTFHFSPRELKNLVMVDEMDSLSPIVTMQVNINRLKRL